MTLAVLLAAAGCRDSRRGPTVAIDDAGSVVADAGAPPADSGTSPIDTGTSPIDTGTSPIDTGTSPIDSGASPIDSGASPIDSGTPPVDAGAPDLALEVNPVTLALTEGTVGAAFTVRLNAAPAGDLAVQISSSDLGAARVTPNTLTFTAANFAAGQTVIVTPVDDADAGPETMTVEVSATGLTSVTIAVEITDDETQQIVTTATTLGVNEGGTATVSVSLAAEPRGALAVMVRADEPAGVAAAPSMLTFDASNWDQPQDVVLSGLHDDDIADTISTVTMSASGLPDVVVTVTVYDDDILAILLDRTTVNLDEGGATETVQVRLTQQPAMLVTVTIHNPDPLSVTLSAATMRFSPSNFDQAQGLLLIPRDDDDADDQQVTVTIDAAGLETRTITVTVIDDDQQALDAGPTSLTLAEGTMGSFSMRLRHEPAGDTTVTVAGSDNSRLTVTPSALTFTPSDYTTLQTVTVRSLQDLDAVDDQVTVTVTGAGTSNTVAVTIEDDETQSIVAAPATIGIDENGSGEVMVALAAQPTGDVTVTATSSDLGVATVAPRTLTFTPADYAQAQAFVISGVDDVDGVDASATVALGSTGLDEVEVQVQVVDDDVQAVQVSPSALALTEGGTPGRLDVRLAVQPPGPVVVEVQSLDPGAVTVSGASLTFLRIDYDQTQTVTVTAREDNDTRPGTTAVTLTSLGLTTRNIPVAIADDDEQTIEISPPFVSVAEGATATISVALLFDPVTPIAVTITPSETTEIAVDPAVLLFTSGDYRTPQTIIVTPSSDPDPLDESYSITISATVADDRTVDVSVADDDTFIGLYTAPGPAASFTDAIVPGGNVDVVGILATADAHLRVHTSAPAAGQCNADTLIRLLDSAGREIMQNDDGGLGGCSMLDPNLEDTRIGAGTYYLTIEHPRNDTEIPAYAIDVEGIAVDVCGNGLLEPSNNETCDDGNTADADGCSGQCGLEGIAELETNDTSSSANPLGGLNDVFRGSVVPAGDVDFFAVDVPAGWHLETYLTVDSFNGCPSEPVATLTLFDVDGATQLYTDSSGGPGGDCGAINPALTGAAQAMSAGRYFLLVSSSTGVTIDRYYLHIRVFGPECGNGVTEGAEHCDDDNTTAGDGCSATCTFEPVATYSAPASTATVTVNLPSAAHVEVIELNVTSTVTLRAEVFAPTAASRTCTVADSLVRLLASDGRTELGADDDDGLARCSLIDPEVDQFAQLGIGTYYLSIADRSGSGPLEIVLWSQAIDVCGNHVIEAANNEQCDDGNLTGGDGCNTTCQLEIAAVLGPPGGTQMLDLAAQPGFSLVRIDTTAASQSITATVSDGMGSCGYATYMELLDDGFARLVSDDDDGPGLCGAISPWRDVGAVNLAVGTYYVLVQSQEASDGAPILDVVVTDPGCNNALIEYSLGENCEDGNAADGDGCNSSCNAEDVSVEVEANDDINSANPSGLAGVGTATVAGQIGSVGDEDLFSFAVPAGQSLTVELQTYGRHGDPTSCTGDTFIQLLDAVGAELANDDDGGEGACSHLPSFGPIGEGTYHVLVRHAAGSSVVPYYFLSLSLR